MNLKRYFVISIITALVGVVVFQSLILWQKSRKDEGPEPRSLQELYGDRVRIVIPQEAIRLSEEKGKIEAKEKEKKEESDFEKGIPVGLFGPDRFSPAERENQWIAKSILQNLFKTIHKIEGRDVQLYDPVTFDDNFNGPKFVYSTNAYNKKPLRQEGNVLELEHIWDYRGYANAVAGMIHSKKAVEKSGSKELMKALLNPISEEVLRIRRELNTRLNDNIGDAEAHSQAAFLRSVLAFISAPGIFYDIRPDLNLITAHLAIARSLDEEVEKSAEFAMSQALLLTMTGRAIDAEKALVALGADQTDPAIEAWKRVIALRIGKNHRKYSGKTDKAGLMVIEKIELIRVAAECLGTNEAMSLLDGMQIPEHFIAGKYALRHDYNGESVMAECERVMESESRKVMEISNGYDKNERVRLDDRRECPPHLITGPQSCDVLPFHYWRDAAVRSVLNCAWLRYRHYYKKIGIERAHLVFPHGRFALASDVAQAFMTMLNDAAAPEADAQSEREREYLEVSGLMAGIPSLMPARFWYEYSFYCSEHQLHRPGNKVLMCWFRSGELPYGTAYGVPDAWDLGPLGFRSQSQVELVHRLYPTEMRTKYLWFVQDRGKLKPDGPAMPLEDFLKDEIELNPMLIKSILNDRNVSLSTGIGLLKSLTKVDKNALVNLARFYEHGEQHELAEATYLQAFKESPDRILVSNAMGWLVNRLHESGRSDLAVTIADDGFRVGSHAGIATRAKLAERSGDLQLAERILWQIEDRYGDNSELTGLWSRNSEVFRKAHFPNGAAVFDKGKAPGAPAVGVVVEGESERSTAKGLRQGMVIVAVDGFSVSTIKDFVLLRTMKDTTSIEITFWDGLQYVTENFHTDVGRKLGIGIKDMSRER